MTPVYALDLSLFHIILLTKLREVGISPDLVGIFSYWYSNQNNVVTWADAQSDEYLLKCGVRQGGLTSPRLFNLYVKRSEMRRRRI